MPKVVHPKPVENQLLKGFDPNFAITSSFLRNLCIIAFKNTVDMSLFRMKLIERIAEIKKPKQFFYFLRFLRINVLVQQNPREMMAVKKNTMENFPAVIERMKDYWEDYVVYEFMKLSTQVFTVADQQTIASSKCPQMAIIVPSHIISKRRLMRIPSRISLVINTAVQLPPEIVTNFFSKNYARILTTPIIADLGIDFLVLHSKFITSSTTATNYVQYIFDTKSPLYTHSEAILPILFTRCGQHVEQFQATVEKLPVCGYSPIFAIPLVSSLYKAIGDLHSAEKNAQKQFGIKEVRTAQAIYQTCPSILTALKLSQTLIDSLINIDTLALLFGKLVPFEGEFLGIFAIAVKYYKAFDDREQKRFADQVKRFSENAIIKSRARSLQLFVEDPVNNLDVAFALACLETSDEAKIEEIVNFFKE
ncbi:hypothetical protein TRFO_37160 [Tritrichomonas foetus]|uniref:Uncharacterized protein n=1 Tax=Tritrichomonas foetus TaxID=1144522 RepID=A0A1J4JBP6_9EUKA|nr:hypothetical protein TRFO_37160 [Tritrichomonas foetus]|eukprot:OHS96618.1 hypothetical protein TRFO_37160 [Tritrichomonas foetus]